MPQKKLIAAAVIFVLLLAVALIMFHPSSSLQVVGNIAPQDLADAKKFAHHQIWDDIFPDYSLRSLKRLPTVLNMRLHMHLVRVEAKPGGMIEITISVRKLAWRYVCYTLKRGTGHKGWDIVTMDAHN